MTGPRPIQQLLPIIQWGEQQRLAREEQDRQNRNSAMATVQTFMNLAPAVDPTDRAALAQLMARGAGTTPEQLIAAVASRPIAAATTGDRVAAQQASTMDSVYPRIREAISQIPDANIQDIALQSVAQQMGGMPAGTARQQATVARRDAISDNDMLTSTQQQLMLRMTPQEIKNFTQADERIRQTWTQLADSKVTDAMRLAIARAELDLNTQIAAANDANDKAKLRQLMAGKPTDLLEALTQQIELVNKGSMTKESRAAIAAPMKLTADMLLQSLGGKQNLPPALRDAWDETFDPQNLMRTSPNFFTRFKPQPGTEKK